MWRKKCLYKLFCLSCTGDPMDVLVAGKPSCLALCIFHGLLSERVGKLIGGKFVFNYVERHNIFKSKFMDSFFAHATCEEFFCFSKKAVLYHLTGTASYHAAKSRFVTRYADPERMIEITFNNHGNTAESFCNFNGAYEPPRIFLFNMRRAPRIHFF